MSQPQTTPIPARRTARRWHGGLVLIVLGSIVSVIGLFQTKTLAPTAGATQDDCPPGVELIAKFEYANGYRFEKPEGGEGLVIISGGTASGASWTSSVPVGFVVVKGGTGSTVTSYETPRSSGTFTNAGLPLVGSGNLPDISHVQFCRAGTTPSTTTTEAATTTTVPDETTAPSTTVAPATTAGPTTVPSTTPGQATVSPTTQVASGGPVPSPTSIVVAPTAEVASATALPETGDPSVIMIVIGIVIAAIGVALTWFDRSTRQG